MQGTIRHNERKHRAPAPKPVKHTSTLTAEEYRTKYLLGGNDSLARLLRYARMRRKEVI